MPSHKSPSQAYAYWIFFQIKKNTQQLLFHSAAMTFSWPAAVRIHRRHGNPTMTHMYTRIAWNTMPVTRLTTTFILFYKTSPSPIPSTSRTQHINFLCQSHTPHKYGDYHRRHIWFAKPYTHAHIVLSCNLHSVFFYCIASIVYLSFTLRLMLPAIVEIYRICLSSKTRFECSTSSSNAWLLRSVSYKQLTAAAEQRRCSRMDFMGRYGDACCL